MCSAANWLNENCKETISADFASKRISIKTNDYSLNHEVVRVAKEFSAIRFMHSCYEEIRTFTEIGNKIHINKLKKYFFNKKEMIKGTG